MSEWISVSDQLPEDNQSVAFVAKTDPRFSMAYLNGRVFGGTYRAGEFSGFSFPGCTMDATHWLPLPPPPVLDNE